MSIVWFTCNLFLNVMTEWSRKSVDHVYFTIAINKNAMGMAIGQMGRNGTGRLRQIVRSLWGVRSFFLRKKQE